MGAQDEGWVTIGRIAGVFGIHGEVKVEPLTDDPDRFGRLDRVFLGPERREYSLLAARRHKSHVLLSLTGVEVPEAASALVGQDIEIPREEAVSLPEGHYFLDQLIGFTVSTVEGASVGIVTDVLRTGSNDVYVVGRGRDEVLIPGTRDSIHRLDLEGRSIIVEPWILQPGA